MLTAELIKQKARELGASVCGIGAVYEENDPQRDPRQILPNAKSIIGFGFVVPRTLYATMERNVQYYTYTTLGVKYPDEELAEIFLLKIGGMIEDEGYDACLQKAIPNLRIKGDKTTNPEVVDTYELIHATPVAEGKPAPDVIIDFGKAAEACGIGQRGLSGKILNEKYGPYMGPLYDNLEAIVSISADRLNAEDLAKKIEVTPIAFLRGRSFRNTIVIIDEAQNLDLTTLKAILTRVGDYSKVVLLGSMNQIDDPHQRKQEQCDFEKVIDKIKDLPYVGYVNLTQSMRSDWCVELDAMLGEIDRPIKKEKTY